MVVAIVVKEIVKVVKTDEAYAHYPQVWFLDEEKTSPSVGMEHDMVKTVTGQATECSSHRDCGQV